MIAVPTTTVSVLGGPAATDAYGDAVASDAVKARRVPMAIHTGRLVVATESDVEARTVRIYTGRAPSWLDVTADDRIRDERTGDVYLIDSVTHPQHPAVPQDLRLDLRRVTA